MNIAMLGQKDMPSHEGGVEVVVTELATRMALLGHNVTVYNRAAAGCKLGLTEYKGVRVRTVGTINAKGLAAASSSFFGVNAAISDKPDVIHFHAEGPCAMIPLANRAGVQSVATVHGLDWRRAKWGRIGSAYIKHGERMAAEHADEIIVLSRSLQGYFEGAYGRRTDFIPNGIDEKHPVKPSAIWERWGLEERSYLLFASRIVPEKGLHRLLKAYRAIQTDKKLVVAGASSDSDAYFESVKALAAADPRVLFVGFAEREELAELYSNAYLYVLPSDLEGMPMGLLEAMAYGCCCLTGDVPECVEVLGGTGMTFSRGDAVDLQAALTALLESPDYVRGQGALARDRVRANYSWDSVVDATLALYEGSMRVA